jgi:4-amino-4-deoxy-L-arabinose transferase-like glycosyltransferase
MMGRLDNRAGHWLLLAAAWSVLCLPLLGRPSLWDIDEGNNAEAARAMAESGDWVVPHFNNQVRYDKPVLLYWLQAGAYAAIGVNELAARLPSAVAALLTVLITYELGRGMFGKRAGLLGGLALGSSISFAASAHFANPDALLNLFTALSLACWWADYTGGGWWWSAAAGAASGMGVLAKGPVGLVLPLGVATLFSLWRRDWRRLFDRRLPLATLAFLLAAAPWYVWVGVETKGQWLIQFWTKHNLERATQVLENHRGPFFYYLLVLLAGFAPWSVFLGPTGWLTWRNVRKASDDPNRPAFQFLACWVMVTYTFFSAASTKLPNYILPLFPAAAILTGSFLDGWRRGEVLVPQGVMRLGMVCLALMGLGVAAALVLAGGVIRLGLLRGRYLPGLEYCAALGAVWVFGAVMALWCLRSGHKGRLITGVAVAGLAFTAGAAAWGAVVVDHYKAPRLLARALPADQMGRDLRVGAYEYFQPSFVFYCRREVTRLNDPWQLLKFLSSPLPAYAVLPASTWEDLHKAFLRPFREVDRRYDLYEGREIVLVTNQ